MPLALKISVYFRVGYLLHIITVLEILFLVLLFTSSFFITWLNTMHLLLRFVIVVILISLPFFPQLDVRSRFQNYKMVRDQFYLYGFQKKIIKPFLHSRCQRDAVRVAASHFGYMALCNDYFYVQGYRWYHILPDFVFKKPVYLLHKKFWQTTFWVRYYKCRIDYKTISLKKPGLNIASLTSSVSSGEPVF